MNTLEPRVLCVESVADLPVLWATLQRLDFIAHEDADGDGVSNLLELLTGHFPGDAADKPGAAELKDAKQLLAAQRYFTEIIFPVLTPLSFDPGRPFPHISNLSLNLAVLIRDASGEEHFARVKVPDSLPALVPLTRQRKSIAKRNRTRSRESYVWIEEVSNCSFPQRKH